MFGITALDSNLYAGGFLGWLFLHAHCLQHSQDTQVGASTLCGYYFSSTAMTVENNELIGFVLHR